MNPMFQILKNISGRLSPSVYSSVSNQNDAANLAFVRQLQKELKQKEVLEIPFSKLPVVVFDLETTGFFPDKGDRIISIGAVKMEGEKVLHEQTFYSLVQSDLGLSKEMEELTGIKGEDLLHAPSLQEVLLNFLKFINSETLVAHHASHEKRFMQQASWAALKLHFQHRLIDTSFLTSIVHPIENFVTLDDFCKHWRISIKRRHHALHDALMTAELWSKNIEAVQKLGYQNLEDVYMYLAKYK